MTIFSKLSKTQYILIGAIMLVLIVGGIAAFLLNRQSNNQNVHLVTQVQIPVPAGWQTQEVRQDEKNAGVFMKLQRVNPQSNAIIRGVPSELEANFNINDLPGKLASSLKDSIEGFTLVNQGITQTGSHQAAEIRYQEKSAAQKQVYETLMIVIPTAHQSFYLVFRAPSSNYQQVENDFAAMTDSFGSYLDAND